MCSSCYMYNYRTDQLSRLFDCLVSWSLLKWKLHLTCNMQFTRLLLRVGSPTIATNWSHSYKAGNPYSLCIALKLLDILGCHLLLLHISCNTGHLGFACYVCPLPLGIHIRQSPHARVTMRVRRSLTQVNWPIVARFFKVSRR